MFYKPLNAVEERISFYKIILPNIQKYFLEGCFTRTAKYSVKLIPSY